MFDVTFVIAKLKLGGSVQRARRPGRIALYGAATPLCNRDVSRHRAAEGAASRPMRVTIAPAPPVAILPPPRNGTVVTGRFIHADSRSHSNSGSPTQQRGWSSGACPAPALHLECPEGVAGPLPLEPSRPRSQCLGAAHSFLWHAARAGHRGAAALAFIPGFIAFAAAALC